MDDIEAIVGLLSQAFPEGGQLPVYQTAAPHNTSTPFAIYRIIGNVEEETLNGNTDGAGYRVEFEAYALTPYAATRAIVNIRERLEGRQFSPVGVSVRVDFDEQRDLGAFTTKDQNEEIFGWSATFTFTPGW